MKMKRHNHVSITVDGREYAADTPVNLRNLLLDHRNELHAAAVAVEQAMDEARDPMLAHVGRLGRLP